MRLWDNNVNEYKNIKSKNIWAGEIVEEYRAHTDCPEDLNFVSRFFTGYQTTTQNPSTWEIHFSGYRLANIVE